MIYIPDLRDQTVLFLKSIGFGFIIGIFYDVFRVLRLIFFGNTVRKATVYIFDFLYCLLCTGMFFIFNLVENNGEMRLYVFLGVFIGFIIYYFSLGTLALRLTDAIVKIFFAIKKFVKRIFISPIYRLISRFKVHSSKKCKKMLKKTEKLKNNSKFHLQKHSIMLYNAKCYRMSLRRNNSVKNKKKHKKDSQSQT